ncbi:MAG: FecR domain-containing protein [Bacteroidales bacterium]|nr:FecR domain-containing protein [Bacteroidales bacterium]
MIKNIIGDDEKSRREFESYLDVWERSADLKDFEEVDADSDWLKVRSRMKVFKTRERIPFRSFALRIAALVVLALGLTWFLTQVLDYASRGTTQPADQLADIPSSRSNYVLDDGTMISLNNGSTIEVDKNFGVENRTIHLKGEAYFDVARNENLPFKIYTSNSVVEVLGTSFCIKESEEEVVVGVVSGKVALYDQQDSSKRVDLLANNTGYFRNSDRHVDSRPVLDLNSISWHTRTFHFNDLTLDKVGKVIADFYRLELIPNGDIHSFDEVHISELSVESLDDVLQTVNQSLVGDVRIVKSGNYLLLTTP